MMAPLLSCTRSPSRRPAPPTARRSCPRTTREVHRAQAVLGTSGVDEELHLGFVGVTAHDAAHLRRGGCAAAAGRGHRGATAAAARCRRAGRDGPFADLCRVRVCPRPLPRSQAWLVPQNTSRRKARSPHSRESGPIKADKRQKFDFRVGSAAPDITVAVFDQAPPWMAGVPYAAEHGAADDQRRGHARGAVHHTIAAHPFLGEVETAPPVLLGARRVPRPGAVTEGGGVVRGEHGPRRTARCATRSCRRPAQARRGGARRRPRGAVHGAAARGAGRHGDHRARRLAGLPRGAGLRRPPCRHRTRSSRHRGGRGRPGAGLHRPRARRPHRGGGGLRDAAARGPLSAARRRRGAAAGLVDTHLQRPGPRRLGGLRARRGRPPRWGPPWWTCRSTACRPPSTSPGSPRRRGGEATASSTWPSGAAPCPAAATTWGRCGTRRARLVFLADSGVEFHALDEAGLRHAAETVASFGEELLLVHAEDPTACGRPSGDDHAGFAASRPPVAEVVAVEAVVDAARATAAHPRGAPRRGDRPARRTRRPRRRRPGRCRGPAPA